MSSNKATISFENSRGFSAMGAGLPRNFLKGNPQTVLITIAAIYGHADPTKVTIWSMSMNLLALYAAGAQIELTREQYESLREAVDEYASIQSAPVHGHECNEAYARFVLKHAADRAGFDQIA